MRIRDPGWKNSDPGSGIQDGKKTDKHTGSAKMVKKVPLPRILSNQLHPLLAYIIIKYTHTAM